MVLKTKHGSSVGTSWRCWFGKKPLKTIYLLRVFCVGGGVGKTMWFPDVVRLLGLNILNKLYEIGLDITINRGVVYMSRY